MSPPAAPAPHTPHAAAQRRALVIVHEPDGLPCQIEARLAERGWQVDSHVVTTDYERPDRPEPWPQWRGYDLLVPMGSVRSLTEKDEIAAWVHDEAELLAEAHHAGTAILGVCFGGQIMAEALGGSVEKSPVTEIGWHEIRPPDGAANPVGPGPWFQWHHDRFEPPPGAEVLAVNDSSVQLFRIGRTVGTQFHPEVDVAHVIGFLNGADEDYLAEVQVQREQMIADLVFHEERNIKQCHALVDWFLDEVAGFGTPAGPGAPAQPESA